MCNNHTIKLNPTYIVHIQVGADAHIRPSQNKVQYISTHKMTPFTVIELLILASRLANTKEPHLHRYRKNIKFDYRSEITTDKSNTSRWVFHYPWEPRNFRMPHRAISNNNLLHRPLHMHDKFIYIQKSLHHHILYMTPTIVLKWKIYS